MAKKQKKPIFPAKKVVVNVLISAFLVAISSLVETFIQNNVQTAAVLFALANGDNSVAEYTSSLPFIVSIVFIGFAIWFFVKAIVIVIDFFGFWSKD